MKLFRLTTGAIAPLASLAFINCAATYKPPTLQAPVVSSDVAGSRADIMKAAQRVLIEEGYQVASSDEASGVISSASKQVRLSPERADCGTTMGIDYLNDNRTNTHVSLGIIVDAGHLSVKATVEGEYLPGDVTQNLTLQCVSRGVIEKDLQAKITAAIGR